MRLTFLGTSAGKPTRERNVSALALEWAQERRWYLFDCGEGTQHQILRSRLSSGKLGTIFITHLHGDHYFGLPGLLASKKLDKSVSPLHIYGPKGLKRFIEAALNISESHLGYRLDISEYDMGDVYVFDRFTLTVLPLVHSKPSAAFYIKEHDTTDRLDEAKLRAMGLEPSPLYGTLKRGHEVVHNGTRIDPASVMLDPVPGRRIVIAGDNADPEVLGDCLDGLDLLVHECTYTRAVFDALVEKTLHTTAHDLGQCAEAHRVKNVIATHINARFSLKGPHDVREISDEIAEVYRGTLFVADDFDRFDLTRGGLQKIEETP